MPAPDATVNGPPLELPRAGSRPGYARRGVARLREALSILRLRPFDTSSELGRSRERYRRSALTTAAAVAARMVASVTSLIAVPLTLQYLGLDRYGVWMTISSIPALFAFADFGIGNGLMNAVAEAHGRDDREAARAAVSSASFLLLGIAVAALAAFAVAYPFVPFARVLNVTSAEARAEAGPAAAVTFACFALTLPLGIVPRVLMGYQRGFGASLWQAVGSALALGAVIAAIAARAGLPWLVLALSGAPLAALALNGAWEFGRVSPWLRPRWSEVRPTVARRIFGTGLLFFGLQVAGALTFSSDNLIAAQMLGNEAVARYAVPLRLFTIVASISAMIVGPLWPAYGEAIARGDIAWVRRTLVRSLGVTVVACGAPSLVLVLCGGPIVELWVGPAVRPTPTLLAGMAVSTVLGGLGAAAAMFLNGANRVHLQVACAVVMGFAAVGLKIALAARLGIAGIIWGGVAAYLLLTAVPMAFYVPRLIRDLERSAPGHA